MRRLATQDPIRFCSPYDRRGQALVEFGIIAFMLSFLAAGLLGIIVIGLGSFQNNIATENAGRVLDGNPLFIKENFVAHFTMDPNDPFEKDDDFENVTARQVYRFLNEYPIDAGGSVLYDESRLILSPADWANRQNLNLTAINRSLLGQYIFDPDLEIDGQQGAYRFPGAVVTNQNANPPSRTVMIPILPGPNANGIGRSFHVESTDAQFFYPVSQDWVAPVVIGKEQNGDGFEFRIIMFHPSQPASTLTIEREIDAQGRLISQTPVEADDGAVDAAIGDPPAGYVLTPATSINPQYGASSSRGQFGLGESFAFATTVRPYRLVFETSSLFRTGTPLYAVKYEYADHGNPGPPLTNASDHSLDFEQLVIDRFTPELRRYIVDPNATSDLDTYLIRLLPNDGGVWRVSASIEFERVGDLVSASEDLEDHRVELRLYKNGVFERVFARFNEPFDTVSERLLGDVLTNGIVDDNLQVRVFTERPDGETYEVRLTGASETNWVSFERIGD